MFDPEQFGPTKMLVQQKCWSRKNSCRKNFGPEKNVGSEK